MVTAELKPKFSKTLEGLCGQGRGRKREEVHGRRKLSSSPHVPSPHLWDLGELFSFLDLRSLAVALKRIK